MQLSLELVFIFIIILWLSGITFFLWKSRNQYQVFLEGADGKGLPGLLEAITKELSHNNKKLNTLSLRQDGLEQENALHIQKIGLLRFNPFRDTGGEQSFVLALTDASDTGIVISALYSRSGTRWYAKKVLSGKGEEFELSDEEQKAIKLAKVIKKP